MAKIAIFGDSYVRRLRDFCNSDMSVPATVEFFCAGGMRADTVFTEDRFRQQFDRLLAFQPQAVFINLGGNDIECSSIPAEIVRHITAVVSTLREQGVQTIYYQEVGKRGKFRGSLTGDQFERQRRAINKKMKKIFEDTFIAFHKIVHYPQHFANDLVHYSHQGMRSYFHEVRRMLLRHISTVKK